MQTDSEDRYRFSLAGLGVEVVCPERSILERLQFDFEAFEPPLPPYLRLSVKLGEPSLPQNLKETFRGPYGVCFDEPGGKGTRHILYPGPVWVRFDFSSNQGQVCGQDPERVYQRLYLTILSRLGEEAELRGLHRVHALGVDSPRGAALFLFPARMGKSTLAVPLLQQPGWQLFSEDTPMVDRRGRLHALPFRLGVRDPKSASDLPPEVLSSTSEKTLIRASHFPIQREPQPCRAIFLGAWTTGPEAQLEPLSKLDAMTSLIRDLVVGVGVPQVAELFIRPGWREWTSKAGLALRRLALATRLASNCDCYRLYLSPEAHHNVKALEAWAQGSL